MRIVKSNITKLNKIELPMFRGEVSMLPFDLETLKEVPRKFVDVIEGMLKGVTNRTGRAYFTMHGAYVEKGSTLRRPGKHIDGVYKDCFTWGGGWKVSNAFRTLSKEDHDYSYNNDKGGIILCSNVSLCKAYVGEFEGEPKEGGDCSHMDTGEGFMLEDNTVYLGNSRMIHESVSNDKEVGFHRVFARITMPENWEYRRS